MTKEEQIILGKQEDFEDKNDIIKHMLVGHSDLKKQIQSDYIMAKLEDKDKQGIIEMVNNAFYGIRINQQIQEKSQKTWQWNKNKQNWELTPTEQKTIQAIQERGIRLFNSFMTRPHMTAMLNRNKKNNYLIKYALGVFEEEETQQEEDKKFYEKIANKLKPEGTTEWNQKRNQNS